MNKKETKNKKNILENMTKTKWTAIFAVVVLAAICAIGFKNNAFAIEAYTENHGYTTSKIPDSIITENDEVAINANAGEVTLPIYNFKAKNGEDLYKIYCIEAGIDFKTTTLTKDAEEFTSDPGLIYILNSVYPYTNTTMSEEEEVWIGQVAIWYYLYQKEPTNANYLIKALGTSTVEEMVTAFSTSNNVLDYSKMVDGDLSKRKGTTPISTLWTHVVALTTAAQTATLNDSATLDISDEVSFTVSEDGTYMQSSVISVKTSSNLDSYKLNKSEFSEGTKVYTSAGEEVSNTDSMTATEFYITVPTSVKTENFTIAATGTFRTLKAFRYAAEGAQSVILTQQIKLSKGDEVNVTVNVPDTAENMPTSIIFVGLIILLSGAGIIYANVKPKEQK